MSRLPQQNVPAVPAKTDEAKEASVTERDAALEETGSKRLPSLDQQAQAADEIPDELRTDAAKVKREQDQNAD